MATRSTKITTAAVVGVLVAGSLAMGANLGLLHKADNSSVGTASAAALGDGAAAGTRWQPQTFTVESAATVVLERSGNRMRLAQVTPSAGWTWSETARTDTTEAITFTSADTTYEFQAQLAPDGTIQAGAGEPIVRTVTVPRGADSSSRTGSSAAPATTGSTRDESHENPEGREQDD